MSEKVPIPIPDYNDPKEHYAFFGLAFYYMQVIEQGLVNFWVIIKSKNVPLNRENWELLFEKGRKKTFGQLLNEIRNSVDLPETIEGKLIVIKNTRDYLAHKFFVMHDVDHGSHVGRKAMINELIEIIQNIKIIDANFDDIWMKALYELGFTKEQYEICLEKIREEAIAKDS